MIKQFQNKGIDILDVFHCPHGPESQCSCRKPKPGMLIEAKNKHGIDMENSWLIGDKESDIVAANNAGLVNTILVKSGHKINKNTSKARFVLNSIKAFNIKYDIKNTICNFLSLDIFKIFLTLILFIYLSFLSNFLGLTFESDSITLFFIV